MNARSRTRVGLSRWPPTSVCRAADLRCIPATHVAFFHRQGCQAFEWACARSSVTYSHSMVRGAFLPDSCVVAGVVPSPNFGERKDGRRPDMILLHYTGMQDADAALMLLTSRGSEVSSHYFIFEDGRIVQLVEESHRAWHAGTAFWAGETDINSCSIGIEIVNPGHAY